MFRRANAESHLLLIIVSFALSVLAIRAYLYLSGYPQIGGSGLHIAHMLWGGIALFIGSTLLLLYRGLFLSRAVAIMTGVGWGFFIDEVGKFITTNNDYFFAPAAVIIYIVFLSTLYVYLRWFRTPSSEPHASDNVAFSDLRELADGVAAGELTHRERELMEKRIARLKQDNEKRYRDLGLAFEEFLKSQPIGLKQRRLDQLGSMVSDLVHKATQGRMFTMVIVSLLTADVMFGLVTLFGLPGVREPLLANISDIPLDITHTTITIARLLTEGVFVAGLIAAEKGRAVLGRRLMIGSLLVMIIILDSVDFYVSQFTASYSVMMDVLLLALVEGRYGNERLHPYKAEVKSS